MLFPSWNVSFGELELFHMSRLCGGAVVVHNILSKLEDESVSSKSKRAIGNLGVVHPKLECFGKFSAASNTGDSPAATIATALAEATILGTSCLRFVSLKLILSPSLSFARHVGLLSRENRK